MKTLTVEQLLELEDKENGSFRIDGTPTGMYADRVSYGNRPTLVFILDDELPCKATSYPYSSAPSQKEARIPGQRCFLADNEDLAIAAAFLDQAIRNKSKVTVHGKYVSDVLLVEHLKIENFGFSFSDYKFPLTENETS